MNSEMISNFKWDCFDVNLSNLSHIGDNILQFYHSLKFPCVYIYQTDQKQSTFETPFWRYNQEIIDWPGLLVEGILVYLLLW